MTLLAILQARAEWMDCVGWGKHSIHALNGAARLPSLRIDFMKKISMKPLFAVPGGVFGGLCLNAAVATSGDAGLLQRAADLGFPTPH